MKSDTTFGASGYACADIQLFRDAAGIDKLAADFPVVQFVAGEQVPAIVDGNAMLYFVLSGALTATMHESGDASGHTKYTASNTDVLPGECVGAFSVLGGERRGINISAAQQSDVLAIDADGLWKLIDESPGFAHKLLLLRSSEAHAFKQGKIPGASPTLIDNIGDIKSRAWFDEQLPNIAHTARATNMPLSMLRISLDQIDQIVATPQRLSRETAVTMACSTIVDALRPTDHTARYTEDELVVLLCGVTTQGAAVVAQRLVESVNKITAFTDLPLPHISAAIGVACLAPTQSPQDFVMTSAAALDRAKQGGQGGISM